MRTDIWFASKGLKCSGWLYVPDDVPEGRSSPAIVMAHGFAGEKETVLPDFAELFAKAGFVTLIFDYRYWGDSEGQPRQQLFALEEVEDVRNAITWLAEQPGVDSRRIGLWGTSYGGGIVIYTATFDRRVKTVVAQVPGVNRPESRPRANPTRWESMGEALMRDRVARYKTGAVNYLKVVSAEGEPCAIPGKEAYEEYMTITGRSPKSKQTWFNGITMESLEKYREFDAVSNIALLAPTPILFVAAEKDSLIPIGAVRETYQMAREPKSLSVLPIQHFEIYVEPWLSRAAAEEISWFKNYL